MALKHVLQSDPREILKLIKKNTRSFERKS